GTTTTAYPTCYAEEEQRSQGAEDGGRCRRTPDSGHYPALGMTLYMVIERFKGGDARPVYRRFREQGRLAPEGLAYVSSWVDPELTHCYQLMETDERALLDAWIARWSDLVDFEVHAVIPSAEAAARVEP